MRMGISLIEVYVEAGDVIFAPLVACESVDIEGPGFDVFTTGDVGIVGANFQIDLLVSVGKSVHLITASSEDDVDYCAAIRLLAFLLQFRIGVDDSALLE